MSTFTETYGLLKPDDEDYYDVSDFNENMDAIDGQMATMDGEITLLDDAIGGIGEKIDHIDEKTDEVKALIGTADNAGDGTVFGQLKKGREKRLAASDNAKHSFGPIKIKTGTTTVFTTFVPPYSGNIKVNMQWVDRTYGDGGGSLMLRIFRGGNSNYFFLPDCSAITTVSTNINRLDDALSVSVAANYVDNYFVIPVEKGIPVVFAKGWQNDHDEGVRLFRISYDMIDIEAE